MLQLFNKKLLDLDWSDIAALKDKAICENEILEYKELFDKDNFAATISAFANTYGGIVIYGVRTSKKENKPEKFLKISENGLEDRVDSICMDSIFPPIFCESKYLESPSEEERVFLVKVDESDRTPHTVENNTKTYIRVSAQKRILNLPADYERVDWLRDRRKKHTQLRDTILSEFSRHEETLGFSRKQSEFSVRVVCVPKFPRERYVDSELLTGVFSSILGGVASRYRYPIGMVDPKCFVDGVCHSSGTESWRHFSEMTAFGSIAFEGFYPIGISDYPDHIPMMPLIGFVFIGFMLYKEMVSLLSIGGPFYCEAEVKGILGTKINSRIEGIGTLQNCASGWELESAIENSILYNSSFNGRNIDREFRLFVTGLLAEFFHVYGGLGNVYDISDKLVRTVLNKSWIDSGLGLLKPQELIDSETLRIEVNNSN